MSDKRRGLGRGLGALIPQAPPPGKPGSDRPVDVFFGEGENGAEGGAATATITEERPAEGEPAEQPAARAAAVIESTPQPAAPRPAPADEPPQQAVSDSGLVPVPGASFAELPIGSIRRNPKQPRSVFDEEAMAELVHSVREIGILQPIVVRPLGTPDEDGISYELVMGERRWRAAQSAGLEAVPAIIRETSDDDLLRDALLENLHRSELNPLEEAAAYQQLLDDFGCTHEELATRIGRSRPQISNTIRLLRLPPTVQRRVAAGVLSAGHAKALLGLDDTEAMDKFAQRIINEGLSVRATEEAVALSDASKPAAQRKKPRAGGHHAELDDLATRLADRLDTRVKISLGSSRGKLSVEFASIEDLNRILEILTPGERGAFRA